MTDKYPDPYQLRAYAEDPRVFHNVKPQDFELRANMQARVVVGNVTYSYQPTTVMVEDETDSFVPAHHIQKNYEKSYVLDHSHAWNNSENFETGSDYIKLTGIESHEDIVPEPMQFDATWLLDTIEIKVNHND